MQFFDPSTRDMMPFPGFNLVYNPEFQQRWEFRNQGVDSSSDDAKSDSGIKPAMKRRSLVPGLLPPENDDPAQSPGVQELTAVNPEGGCGVITPNPKEAARRRRKEESVKKRAIKKKGDSRECRKRKSVVISALLDDLRKFRESLVEELRIEGENLSGWMKDEMNKIVRSNGASALGGERKEAAKDVDKNRTSEHPKKPAGDSKRGRNGPSGRSSQRKKKAESVSCSQALGDEKRETQGTADKSKSLFLPLDHSLQLQRNSLTAGHQVPGSAALIEKDKGESLDLFGNGTRGLSEQSAQAAASSFLIMPGSANRQPESPLSNFPSKNSGKKTDTDDLSGYYQILLQGGRSSYPNQIGSKDNISSIQTTFPSPLYRDMGNAYGSTITNVLPSDSPLGDGGSVLGLKMNGGPARFSGHGNRFF